ncbi:hypothetical protein GOQ30_12525 [Flavobacterium sp. TP390]|uniref:Uncharacterized protein n=1 Tax=Flavobacterium profundi TaxID=1774945 RepID=A0A6I4IT27_9FLAO|nr:hypothetical protein [Flavobacterium profundi]MVO09988.1 hypothetical protein [Flavobacterium profundi]
MAGLFSWLTGFKEQQSDKTNFQDDKFKAGQVWKYNTRIGEENSTITILKVEKYEKDGIVIHIYVNGLKVKNPHKPTGFSDEIGHLPLSKDAVLKSVTTLVSENNKLPDYKEGYNNWKEAFDNNKGGIFSITVQEAVKYVEEAMSNAKQVKE